MWIMDLQVCTYVHCGFVCYLVVHNFRQAQSTQKEFPQNYILR